jgi:hypothetical protein
MRTSPTPCQHKEREKRILPPSDRRVSELTIPAVAPVRLQRRSDVRYFPPMLRTAAVLLLLLAASGCSGTFAVHLVTQPDAGALTPHAEGCDVQLYEQTESPPSDCREVGDVFLGDTGYTTNCGRERAREELLHQACRFGADAVQIVRAYESSPLSSTCYQVRARFLVCTDDGEGEAAR